MSHATEVPKRDDLMWPTLRALDGLGGSASNRELDDRLGTDMELPDAVLEVMHGDGPQTELSYESAWARSALRAIGAVETSGRGVWSITEVGRRIGSADEVRERVRRKRQESRRREPESSFSPGTADAPEQATDESWKSALLDTLREMPPDGFERLCQRLLREHGFSQVRVTGRSGDGGIDGTGVLRFNLLSFHVSFRCKRYSGPVGPASVRDFRGALAGRSDKGLLITTGRFTRDAEREAVREGAMAIDLIDGGELCNLLRERQLGVVAETVERVERGFFEQI